jgi:uncharacterized SAM-binding protein YcdF (DUF218 family)
MATDAFARVCRVIGAMTLGLLLIGAFTPAVNVLARRARPDTSLQKSDAIVVLGAGAHGDGSLKPASLVRLVHGVVLYRRGYAPLLVVSGGPAEVNARAQLAVVLGVPAAAMAWDAGSHTTREEARRIAHLLRTRSTKSVLLVSNSQHLARAARVFEREGFVVHGVPADFVSNTTAIPELRLELARVLLQEALARAYYRALGAW